MKFVYPTGCDGMFEADPYTITFAEILMQDKGKTVWTLRQCGKCAALVTDEGMQDHANWHAHLRSETVMGSLGFGGTGL